MARDDGGICPVCGKRFFPYPQHVYKDKRTKNRVCSYPCMLNSEVPKKDGRKERFRYTVYCPDGYIASSTSDAGRHMGIKAGAVQWLIRKGELKSEKRPYSERSK